MVTENFLKQVKGFIFSSQLVLELVPQLVLGLVLGLVLFPQPCWLQALSKLLLTLLESGFHPPVLEFL